MQAEGIAAGATEDLYRDLVESSRDLICTHDLEGKLLTVNEAAARLLGYAPEELVNYNLRELLLALKPEDFDTYLENIKEHKVATGIIELRARSGEHLIWEYASTLRTDGVAVPFVRGMAHDVTRMMNSQKALRDSEQRLRIAAEVGRMYAWEWNPGTGEVLRSAECEKVLGTSGPAGESVVEDYFAQIHPEDRENLWKLATSLTPESPSYRTEYRRFRAEGDIVWLGESGYATFDGSGNMVRLVGMTADITERKNAEEQLAKFAGRLIHAQEEERSNVAWELHEDVCQRLSVCGMELAKLDAAPLKSRAEIRSHTVKLRTHLVSILEDLRMLSDQLHPRTLDLLPVGVVLRGLCREMGERHNVHIEFEEKGAPSTLPKGIAICLYRVTQEALRNGIKHSEVGHFRVQLRGTAGAVQLSVSDAGVGFDPSEAKSSAGLGLASMQERVALVKGTIQIDSKPQGGTEIVCSVPVTGAGDEAESAAGK